MALTSLYIQSKTYHFDVRVLLNTLGCTVKIRVHKAEGDFMTDIRRIIKQIYTKKTHLMPITYV